MPDIDHYVVQLRNGANTTTIQTHTVDAATFTTTFEGLEPDTDYKVRIYSQAAGVLSSTPKVLSITTEEGEAVVPLQAPAGLTFSRGPSEVIVETITPPATGPTPDGYLLLLMNSAFTSTMAAPYVIAPGDVPVGWPSLDDGTEYGIRCVASLAGVYSDFTLDTVVPVEGSGSIPEPPAEVLATPQSDGSVIYTWDPVDGATSYNYLEVRDSADSWNQGNTTDLYFVSGGVGHTWFLAVAAVNAAGASDSTISNTVTGAIA